MSIQEETVRIRPMAEGDIARLADAFQNWGGGKGRALFTGYFAEQGAGERDVFIAEADGALAGYVTLVWRAQDGPFAGQDIPEIKDFNVLAPFRRRGIGGRLMDAAEARAGERGPAVCIGVGLYRDYGPAQRMYVKRGYVPDGSGVWYGAEQVAPGRSVPVDDDLALYFSKRL